MQKAGFYIPAAIICADGRSILRAIFFFRAKIDQIRKKRLDTDKSIDFSVF